jgi:hypothetical protein
MRPHRRSNIFPCAASQRGGLQVGSTGTHTCTRPAECTTTSRPLPHLAATAGTLYMVHPRQHAVAPSSCPGQLQKPRCAAPTTLGSWGMGRLCCAVGRQQLTTLHHGSIPGSRRAPPAQHHKQKHTPWAGEPCAVPHHTRSRGFRGTASSGVHALCCLGKSSQAACKVYVPPPAKVTAASRSTPHGGTATSTDCMHTACTRPT